MRSCWYALYNRSKLSISKVFNALQNFRNGFIGNLSLFQWIQHTFVFLIISAREMKWDDLVIALKQPVGPSWSQHLPSTQSFAFFSYACTQPIHPLVLFIYVLVPTIALTKELPLSSYGTCGKFTYSGKKFNAHGKTLTTRTISASVPTTSTSNTRIAEPISRSRQIGTVPTMRWSRRHAHLHGLDGVIEMV